METVAVGLVGIVWVLLAKRIHEGLLRQGVLPDGHTEHCAARCDCDLGYQMGYCLGIALLWLVCAPVLIVTWRWRR